MRIAVLFIVHARRKAETVNSYPILSTPVLSCGIKWDFGGYHLVR